MPEVASADPNMSELNEAAPDEPESPTLMDYMHEAAEQEGDGITVKRLLADSNLYGQAGRLRHDPRIHVFTNRDEVILRKSDLRWLERVFEGRITVFPGGGHLGNSHDDAVQAAYMDALGPRAAAPADATPPVGATE
jgi:hypothetical protein